MTKHHRIPTAERVVDQLAGEALPNAPIGALFSKNLLLGGPVSETVESGLLRRGKIPRYSDLARFCNFGAPVSGTYAWLPPISPRQCRSEMKVVAFIEPPLGELIGKILRHSGLRQASALRGIT